MFWRNAHNPRYVKSMGTGAEFLSISSRRARVAIWPGRGATADVAPQPLLDAFAGAPGKRASRWADTQLSQFEEFDHMPTHPTPASRERSARAVRLRRASVRLAAIGTLTITFTGLTTALPGAVAVAESQASSITGLRVGASGDGVRQVQQALINQGIAVPGGADGVFGAGTETALKTFQTRAGLTANGTVTAATAIALGLVSSPFLGLTQGSTGDAVRQLQQKLIDKGIAVPGGADGVYGPGTTAAVKQFQANLGYFQSGSVNAATAAALGSSGGAATPAAPATADAPAERDDAPAPAVDPNNLLNLAIGASGANVKHLQQLLIDAGVTVVGGADGRFGALTQQALKSFQSAKGLTATGTVDQATIDALTGAGGDTAPQGLTSGSGGALLGLEFGATGEGVKTLQTALMKAGFTVRGGADGVFGNATLTALKAFQEVNGLGVTGTVNQATANAITAVINSGTTSEQTSNGSLVGLKAGAVGSDVQTLQQKLIEAGVEVRGGADGIFGPATAQALKNFQTSQGLPATGEVDQATANALANPAPAQNGGNAGGSNLGYPEYGEKGERVLALQAALVRAGISLRGGVDGDFGSATSAAVMEFQSKNGLPVTGKVNEATAAALGLGAAPAPLAPAAGSVSIEAFPVASPCGYADTWHFDRGGGRQHLGVDVIAPTGTTLYAAVSGKITKIYTDQPGSLSGNGIRITKPDGTYLFYAHMNGLADGIALGVPVTAGQVVGTVGATGNTGGTSHLHLEIHPNGGSAINPYPVLRAFGGC